MLSVGDKVRLVSDKTVTGEVIVILKPYDSVVVKWGTSDRREWVTTYHRPTENYIERIPVRKSWFKPVFSSGQSAIVMSPNKYAMLADARIASVATPDVILEFVYEDDKLTTVIPHF